MLYVILAKRGHSIVNNAETKLNQTGRKNREGEGGKKKTEGKVMVRGCSCIRPLVWLCAPVAATAGANINSSVLQSSVMRQYM